LKRPFVGTVPLGYDVKDCKIVVNRAEADIVVDIFQRYLRLKSVRVLAEELATAEIKASGGSASMGPLYLLLQNRTYRGEITHKGRSYAGEHAAAVRSA
jgi:site-specific DNA recombinase